MRKQILSVLLVVCLVFNMLPGMAFAEAAFRITYNANGGSGLMEEGTAIEGISFTMPDCTFTPPEGKQFQCWAIGSAEGTQLEVGGSVTFAEDTTVYAVWKDTLSITTTNLPDGTVGTAYSQTLTVTGSAINVSVATGSKISVSTVTWSVADGNNLPAGLILESSTGVIFGTPTAVGQCTFTVQAANGTSPDATKELTITIAKAAPTVWDGTSAQYFDGGTGTADDPYQIATAEQLTLLAGVINQYTYGINNTRIAYGTGNRQVVIDQDAQTFTYLQSASYILTEDIMLNDTSNVANWATTAPSNTWKIIGVPNGFKGIFDGNGHTISGLFYSDISMDGVGLFYSNYGTIKNLYLKEGYINVSSGAGSIVGRENRGTIDNCHSDISVSADYRLGGLVYNNSGTIKNSSNAGTVIQRAEQGFGSNCVGGIASSNIDDGVIENCTNTGTVTGTYMVGGIVGAIQKSSVSKCTNSGTVTGTKAVGGISGNNDIDSAMDTCINTGIISGTNWVGGIVGYYYGGSITNVFSPKGVTVGAVSDIGKAEPYYGYIIGKGGNYTSGGSDHFGNITISPVSAKVAKGGTKNFTVKGSQSGDIVEWSVTGGINGTTVTSDGLLTVADVETAASLTVTALVKTAGVVTGAGSAIVTIGAPPTVTKVTISPDSADIVKDKTQQFIATVAGENSPSQEVAWTVTGGVSGTTISEAGLLTVAKDETAKQLTVTAISVEDNTKSASATVTVTTYIGKVWDGTSAQYFDGGTGTASDPYQIRTAEQLALLADIINGNVNKKVVIGQEIRYYTQLQTAYYVQTADIKLNDTINVANWGTTAPSNVWKIIGNQSYFCGVFDGKSYTISGLYYNGTIRAGLFGNSERGIIKNVNVGEGYIKGGYNVGGVVAFINTTKIYNCSNNCTVNGISSVGGIVGGMSGEVENCSNSGRIDGGRVVGGVVGFNSGGRIVNCVNTGYISAYDVSGYFCGGVLGSYTGGTISNIFSPKGYVKYATANYGSSSNGYAGYLIGSEGNASNSGSDSYGSITISPAGVMVAKGGTKNFTVSGAQSGDTVEWSVTGGINDTTITSDGLLTVASGETAKSLTVMALVKTAGVVTGVGTATVTIGTTYIGKVWDGTSAQYFDGGTGTVDDPYQIATAEQLALLAGVINKCSYGANNTSTPYGTIYKDDRKVVPNQKEQSFAYLRKASYVLTQDILLNDTSNVANWATTAPSNTWKMIGDQDNNFNFAGVFDGDGHTISGLFYSNPTSVTFGLFYVSSGTIKNLYLSEGYINVKTSAGSIIGDANIGTIDNCHNYISVSANTKAGGLACHNAGTIINSSNAGKVTQRAGQSSGSGFAGGITSINGYGGVIENCTNTGTVTSTQQVGGIAAIMNIDTPLKSAINNCTNTGTVTGTQQVGGIVGEIQGSGCTVNYCTNTGLIIGDSSVGGISGLLYRSAIINNSINTGTIRGTKVVGGIVGMLNSASMTNVFSPKGTTVGATADIGQKESYYGDVIGWNIGGNISGGSDHSSSITISPASTTLAKGGTKTFTAKGTQSGDTIEWSVTGGMNGTTITSDGLLTVASSEIAIKLTVTAIVKTAGVVTGAGSATVTIGTPPIVTKVTISPASAVVAKSKTQQFGATVTGENSPSQDVAWTVTGGISGTTISEEGLLTIAKDETATQLTVTATSAEDNTKSASTTVTIGAAPTITTTSLPDGMVGTIYSQTLTAGTTTPITWSVAAGSSLPKGLTLEASTGVISGTPIKVGKCTFTIQAANGTLPDATKELSITIAKGTISVWNGTSATYFDSGTGKADDPYQIRTAEQLTLLAGVINQYTYASNNKSTAYGTGTRKVVTDQDAQTYAYLQSASYILTEDILFNDTSNVEKWATEAPSNTWKMIGNEVNYFKGVFDGDGHTISGLYYRNSNSYGIGLFKSNYGAIKNLYLKEGYINALGYAGSIVGYGNYGTIDNCHSYISVSANDHVGGLVDCNYSNGTIKNSSNSGKVTQGAVQSSDSAFAGGIASLNYYIGIIESCTNTGTVRGTQRVGGIVGNTISAISKESAVNNCANTGTVTGTKWVGGIVGNVASDLQESTVNNCINTGIISGTNMVGGITGYIFGSMTNVFSPKGVTAGATADIGTAEPYYGHIIGKKASGVISGGSDQYGSITISPVSATVAKGGTKNFTVNGAQSSDMVEWSVVGGMNGTAMSADGLLTVASGETATSLAVIAIVKTAGVITGAGAAKITIGTPPTVTKVTISPASAVVAKSKTQQFSATVAGDNSPSQEVAWKVAGGISGTTISEAGLLTVAKDETATQLTVTATSAEDNTKSASTTVTVTELTTVDLVTVTPSSASVVRGSTQQFSVAVTGKNSPAQTVTWSITGTVQSGTGIDSNGLLTVAEGETADNLTINATSTVDNTKSATAMVTLTTTTGTIWNGTSAQYFDGGTGTASDPYQIRTAEQLALLADVINGNASKKVVKGQEIQTYVYLRTAYYVLTADIKLNDTTNVANWSTTAPSNNWKIIGKSYCFNGIFDGKSYTISGLYCKGGNYAGLFGYSATGTIKNVNVSNGYVTGTLYIGGVVGLIDSTKIYNCSNSCMVYGNSQVGGVVGASANGEVKNCSNSGRIDGGYLVGGVVAIIWGGIIQDCINTGYVSAFTTNEYGYYFCGGVIGASYTSSSNISSIFSPKGCVKNATVDYGSYSNLHIGYLIGSGGASEGSSDHYGSITISPASTTVAKGTTKTFTVNGTQSGNTVEWSVAGGIDGTTITANGLLTVANGETAKSLSVTAIVKTNGIVTGAGTASVTIGTPATVTKVTISPDSVTVVKGKTQQFNATVTGENNPSQKVAWSVTGGISTTTISDAGLLTIAKDEIATQLTVTATSTEDNTKSASVMVKVTELTTVDFVTVTPSTASVARGSTQQFSVAVTGKNSPAQTVTWSITGTVQSGTGIDSNGLLTVAEGETADNLTINATSTVDNTKSATAMVTLTTTTGTVWNGTSAQYFDGGTGTASDPYQIRTAEQLALLAGVINQHTYGANNKITAYGTGTRKVVPDQGAQTFAYLQSAAYRLTEDILLNDTSKVANWATTAPSNTWKIIGYQSNYFKGVFDGDGHTISGLFYNNSAAFAVGLFQTNYGTIKNLYLKEGYINTKYRAGSIVGDENRGTIDNCHNYISVAADYSSGGLVYNNYSGTIKNSSNAGNVTQRAEQDFGTNFAGGIASYDGNGGVIENCTNTGTVTGTYIVGGIVGAIQKSSVSKCTNTGTVTGTKAVGGISGDNDSQSVMDTCINTGIISGTNWVGGIVGYYWSGSITNVFSPKGVTVGAVSDIGKAEPFYGYIIGKGGSYTSGGSDQYGSITISPASATIAKGESKTFTVNGAQSGDTVEWSVTGGINGTTITSSGLLAVSDDETAKSLTVTALVKTSGVVTGAGTAKVTIGTPVTVTEVTISPKSAEVVKGKTQQFSATVKGNNNPPQDVEWNVTGGVIGTTISESGLLLVGELETAATLTVKATSTADSNVYATATVSVASAPKLYTVTFNSLGGSTVNSIGGIKEGRTITFPDDPTRSGYRFDGWFTKENGSETSFTTLTPVIANITVYAKWTKVLKLSGTVYEIDASTPVLGVVVTLSPVSGTTAKTTGGDGRFGFTNLPEGMYTVTAVYPDGSSASVNVSSDYENVKIIKPVPHIEITTQPADATIVSGITDSLAVFNVLGQRTPYIADKVGYQWYWLKGTTPNGGSGTVPDERVTNSKGTPVSGSQITLNSANGTILTRGTYRLYAIAYDVNGEADKVYSRVVTLKVIGTNTIEGVVKNEDGTLIKDVSVKLEAIGTPAYTPYTSSTNPQTTGVDGAYQFKTVPDGTYKLAITLPGGGVIESKNVVLPKTDPDNPTVIEIVVPDKASIKINGQPQDVTIKKGTTATLTVNAAATDGTALTYQWYKNSKNANSGGTALTDATEKDYTPISTTKGTFYYYCVVAGGSLKAVTTRNAKVTVVAYGVVSGTVKTKKGAFIANATVELVNTDTPVQTGFTTSSNPQSTKDDGKYSFTEVPDGNYKLKITLPDGTKFEKPLVVPGTNEDVIITQPDQPTITITGQSGSMTVVLRDIAEFNVTASVSNGDTVLYQWYKNTEKSPIGGTAISGATKATYRASTTAKSVSYYYCVLNAAGAEAVTSNPVKLTVRNTPADNMMTIEGDVLDDTTPGKPVQGAIVTMSPKAGTSKNPQTTGADGHYKFENLLDGKYTVTVTLPDGGTVTEEIIIDDGEITPAQPSDIEVPTTNRITIAKQPTDIQITTDMAATFDTKATATKAGVTYQWYSSATNTNSSGTKLDGKTDAILQLDKQVEGTSYYYCVVGSKDATEVATRAAKLTVKKAAGDKGDVGGSIVDDESGKSVEGASVKLMKNGTDGDQFGSTVITGADGKFQFTDIPYGSYSLVAQKKTQTITRQISIKNSSTTENLTLLSGGKLTRVEVAQGAPSTAVENLEDMFTSDDAVIAQQPGATVEIKLVVEQKDNPEDKQQIEAVLTDNQRAGLYLDAKLVKTISGTITDNTTEYIQPSSGQVLHIVLDLPKSLQGKNGYKIIRSHTENGVTSIRIIDNPVYDETLQTLTFEADAFSTYAVAYTQAQNYSVTVLDSQDQTTSGTGFYHENDTVMISAGTRSGYTFTGWTSTDSVSFAAVGSATTTFTMPAKNVTVSANWKANEGGSGNGGGNGNDTGSGNKSSYSVIVDGSQSGDSSGAGLYKEGDTVAISAGARNGYTFTGWTSTDGVSFADAGSETTSFIMAAKAVTVTANWKANKGGSGNGTNTGNGSDTDSGNKKGTNTGNGSDTDSGNKRGTSTENGSSADSGNKRGTNTGNGNSTDSGNESNSGSKSNNSTGRNGSSASDNNSSTGGNSSSASDSNSSTGGSSSSASDSNSSTGGSSSSASDSGNSTGGSGSSASDSNSNTEESDSSISENGSNAEKGDSNADSDQITQADLNEAKDDALKNLADQREKAINSLPTTLTGEQLKIASDEIERIYNDAMEKIQNAETQDVVSTIYDKAISDINTVLTDRSAEATGENTGENNGTGKPFILFNALLTLAAILAAGLLLLLRGKEWAAILAAVSALAALAVFLFTLGLSGFALVNLWTIACAAFAAWPIGLLWHTARKNSDGIQ